MSVALFVPCYMDQLYPQVAIAVLQVLERLGLEVVVPEGAVCCGQPAANAGFRRESQRALDRFDDTFKSCEHVVVPSGSCAAHLRAHADSPVAERVTEFCAFLHDEIGVERVAGLGSEFPRRVALHVGCHGLRGLGLARPSEIQAPPFNKVQALLETVSGISFTELARPDECCGFGGTFAVAEPAVSTRMGRDRLRDFQAGSAEAVVSTDVSCLMHMGGLARRAGDLTPMLHVAEVLAGAGA